MRQPEDLPSIRNGAGNRLSCLDDVTTSPTVELSAGKLTYWLKREINPFWMTPPASANDLFRPY
jgi:hypothetical protein